ncbi:hypothetical protein VTO73DRAFT_8952 [Trametes versicolor]
MMISSSVAATTTMTPGMARLQGGLEDTSSITEATRISRPHVQHVQRVTATLTYHERVSPSPDVNEWSFIRLTKEPGVYFKPQWMHQGAFRKVRVAGEGKTLADRQRFPLPVIKNDHPTSGSPMRIGDALRPPWLAWNLEDKKMKGVLERCEADTGSSELWGSHAGCESTCINFYIAWVRRE